MKISNDRKNRNKIHFKKKSFLFRKELIKKILKVLKIIIIFILFISLISVRFFRHVNLRVCMCSPGKMENRYIREFVEHYKNYNVDKIYLYDNNDLNGEKFEEVINDYIKDGFVEIINFRGKKKALLNMMNDCYLKNFNYYDWLIFFEIDEFIFLRDINNIKLFLGNSKFHKCDRIQLNWLIHTDNNLLHYDNRSLKERFPEKEKRAREAKIGDGNSIKSILKGHIPNIKIECVHTLNHKLKSCDGNGNYKEIFGINTKISDFYYYYIDHYNFKSTEEFIKKINKGDVLYYKDNIIERIKVYFYFNEITKEKINMIEKGIKIDLSGIVNNFKNKKSY